MIKLQLNYTDSLGNKKSKTYSYVNNLRTDAELKNFAEAVNDLTTNTLGTVYKIDTNILLDDPSDDIVTPVIESSTALLNPNFSLNPTNNAAVPMDYESTQIKDPDTFTITANHLGNGTLILPAVSNIRAYVDGDTITIDYYNYFDLETWNETVRDEDVDLFNQQHIQLDYLPVTLTSDGVYESATATFTLYNHVLDDNDQIIGEGKEVRSGSLILPNNFKEAGRELANYTQLLEAADWSSDALPDAAKEADGYMSGTVTHAFPVKVLDADNFSIHLNGYNKGASAEGNFAGLIYSITDDSWGSLMWMLGDEGEANTLFLREVELTNEDYCLVFVIEGIDFSEE